MSAERQLEGAIDYISPDTRVQGWARDIANQYATIRIGIVADDRLVAAGDANGFRPDLLEKGVGHGWYGFALRPVKPVDWPNIKQFHLVDLEVRALIGTYRPSLPERFEPAKVDLRSMSLSTDEFLADVGHLRGFASLLERYVSTFGAETFVDHGYCLVLGRSADNDGLRSYSHAIAQGHLPPLEFLRILLESDEARQNRRRLPTPQSTEFPFRWT
jgi:hypothetical protein